MNHQASQYGRIILLALSWGRKHVYAGTVPAGTKARRRAADRVASRSRRRNR
jgi:hypothetical protein